jgi:tetratricopeptide (TPR) repeat protein
MLEEIYMNPMIANAQKALDDNKYEEALDLYNKLIIETPTDTLALHGAAKCLYRLNRLHDAIEVCQKALVINLNLPLIHVILADAYDALQDLGRSREEASAAFALDPNSAEVLGCYGTRMLKDNRLDDGISILEKATVLDDNLYFIHRNLVVAYSQKKDKKRVIKELKKLYRLRPSLRLSFEIIFAYMDKMKLFNIVGLVFTFSVFVAFVFKAWNLLWISTLCIGFLIALGLILRRLYHS